MLFHFGLILRTLLVVRSMHHFRHMCINQAYSKTKSLGVIIRPFSARTLCQADFLVESELVIVQFTRLQQTADLHGTLAFLVSHLLLCLLAVLGEKFSIVTGKLLQ